jgi:hypothetical protein
MAARRDLRRAPAPQPRPMPPSIGDGQPSTRRAQALRRAAANRARARCAYLGPAKPPVEAGDCDGCGGWGVVGASRVRCARCGGEG